MRRLHLFALVDDERDPFYTVSAIHDERGYRQVQEALARSFGVSATAPDIQVVDVDLLGDRCLRLRHFRRHGIPLEEKTREQTLTHLRRLWGYEVAIEDSDSDA